MITVTVQEIEVLKKAREELKTKTTEEIIELKKETDHLVIEKEQLFSSHGKVEEAVIEAYQCIPKSIMELDAIAKENRLGVVIV